MIPVGRKHPPPRNESSQSGAAGVLSFHFINHYVQTECNLFKWTFSSYDSLLSGLLFASFVFFSLFSVSFLLFSSREEFRIEMLVI